MPHLLMSRINREDSAIIKEGSISIIFAENKNKLALHLWQIGQERITTTIVLVNLTYNLFRF